MSTPASKTDDSPWTIGRLLNWTADYFAKQGLESPRLEAEVLLAHARGCQRIMLYTAFEEVASEELRTKFRELVKRRTAGEPFAYLAGKREFFSLEFAVTRDVLIPRPETEQLVMTVVDWVRRRGLPSARIIDLGTGSGCIAVCLAKQLPGAQITAVDVSEAALAVARRNAERHGVSGRVEFARSDLLADVPAGQFDVIVSNPPYITSSEMATLDASVRDHEPHLALDGGADGTDVIARIIDAVPRWLVPGGLLAMEISPTIVSQVNQLVAGSSLRPLPTLLDLAGRVRIVQAEMPQ
jgi:release factor glutamine methyltransferase